jgi:hypothetical protein
LLFALQGQGFGQRLLGDKRARGLLQLSAADASQNGVLLMRGERIDFLQPMEQGGDHRSLTLAVR